MVGCSHRLSKSEELLSWVLFSSRAEKWQMVAFIKCARTETVTKEVESERRALQVVFPYVFKSFRNSSWHKIYQTTTLTIISFTFRTVESQRDREEVPFHFSTEININLCCFIFPSSSFYFCWSHQTFMRGETVTSTEHPCTRNYRNWLLLQNSINVEL